MEIKVTFWPKRGQVVITDEETKHEATVSVGTTGELICVDDENGDNHYIGFSAERAKNAIRKVLKRKDGQ